MRYFLLLLFTLLSIMAISQVHITAKYQNTDIDTIILAHYFADRVLVTDTIVKNKKNRFEFGRDSLLPQGMYLLVQHPAGSYQQIILNEDQQFEVTIDTTSGAGIRFKGSKENEEFYGYLSQLDLAKKELTDLNDVLATTDSTDIQWSDLQKKRTMLQEKGSQLQKDYINNHPGQITAALIESNIPMDFPEFEGTEMEIQQQQFNYYKKHYFDSPKMTQKHLIRTPIFHQRIDHFIKKMTVPMPDSIINSLETVLSMLESNPEAYEYYLSFYLNEYARGKFIGHDAVFVHLALEYYNKGKAPWVSEENLKQIVAEAKKIMPTLIGKPAPDFTVFTKDGSPVSLSDFQKDFTIIVFWKPSCPHCSEAMPHIIDFNEKYKERVDVLTVCTNLGDKYAECWKAIEEKNMQNLLNTGDQYHQSRIFSKYYANTTPTIYVLDKDKNIALKKIPAENIEAIMNQFMGDQQEIDSNE